MRAHARLGHKRSHDLPGGMLLIAMADESAGTHKESARDIEAAAESAFGVVL